jgi:dienelactone hydrolase
MSCCPPGSWPALEAQPGSYNGKEEDLGNGVKAYVVHPPTSSTCRGGLISFPDIFPYDSARCKGVADQFAAAGFVVVHVDFVGADVYTDDQNLFEWVQARSYVDFIRPRLTETVIPYLNEQVGERKIGAIGFCWGCYIAFQACADPDVKDTITATALFHPTLKLNAAFGKDPESLDIAEHVTCPTLFVPAGNDPAFLGPDGSVMQLLQKTCPSSQSVVMTEMMHGFVNRGDIADPAVKRDVQATLELAMTFLIEHMSQV